MSEWISVKDRLPGETKWCLVCADGAMNCMAWNKERNCWEDWARAENPNVFIDYITHWMPLPEPPK